MHNSKRKVNAKREIERLNTFILGTHFYKDDVKSISDHKVLF